MSSTGSSPKVEESENEKALADVANQDWQRYEHVFAPEEEQLIGEYERLGTPAYAQRSRDLYANTTMQATPSAMAPAGLNPGSGRYVAGVNDANTATGAGLGRATNAADLATRGNYLQGLGSLIQLGRNLKNTSTAGLSAAANRDYAENVAEANADITREAGLYGGLGAVAGAGLYAGANYLANRTPTGSQPVTTGSGLNQFHGRLTY